MKTKESIFPTIVFPIILFIFGMSLLFLGIKHYNKNVEFLKSGVKVQGIITKIEEREITSGDYFHVAHAEYIVNSKKYSVILPEYNGSMYTGKEIVIYCNPNNPTEFDTYKYGHYIELIVGTIFTILSLLVLISIIKNYIKKKKKVHYKFC